MVSSDNCDIVVILLLVIILFILVLWASSNSDSEYYRTLGILETMPKLPTREDIELERRIKALQDSGKKNNLNK